jgi:uncharacterized protein (TIGR03086 family)
MNDTSRGPTDAAGWHRQAVDAVRPIVAGIDAADWQQPTACDGWNVHDLLNHVIAGNWWASRLAAGETIDEVGTDLDGDQVGDDALASYDRSSAAAVAAFEAPGALDAPCAVSYGPVPGSVYAGHRTLDVLVHGVDLAGATGQEPDYAPELVDACWAIVEPQLALLQASGAFGTPVDVGSDADPLTRLLGELGRDRR